MKWYVRLIKKNCTSVEIAYSFERNDTCDGLLRYEEPTHVITIERMSEGADEFTTKWLFQHIHRLLKKNELTPEKRVICIG
jgi:hypothetical protein